MNNSNAGALGFERRVKPPTDTFNLKNSFIRTMNARQNFSQRAFARAVLAHERVATAGQHIETDVLERDRSRKSFADAASTNDGNGSFGTQGNKLKHAR